jgi:DNA polymerase III epsilon subunit-like protein
MSIGENLLRFKKNQEFACFDLETESLNGVFSRPWQLGMVTFTQDKDLRETNRYIWWPDLKVSKRAAEVTRFNYQDYKNKAEDPKKVLEELEDTIYSKNHKVLNQNLLGFDCQVIAAWRRALGMEPYYDFIYEDFKVYDTLALSRATKKGVAPDTSSSIAFLSWQYKLLSLREKLKCSLGAVSKEMGLVFDPNTLHDALFDVRLCKEVFKKQIWTMELV